MESDVCIGFEGPCPDGARSTAEKRRNARKAGLPGWRCRACGYRARSASELWRGALSSATKAHAAAVRATTEVHNPNSVEEWLSLAREQEGRLWSKIDKNGPTMYPHLDQCWRWTASTDKDGYGKFCITGPRYAKPKQLQVQAHRLVFQLANGPIDASLLVLHRCDNPPCVNPAHLRAGTNADNMADMMAKGRNRVLVGEQAPGAKLTQVQVDEIRLRAARGERYEALATEYGISASQAQKIVAGTSWRAA